VSRPQKLPAHSSSMTASRFEARSCAHVHSPACTPMWRRERPCASIRVHALQCALMRLSTRPLKQYK